MLRILRRSSSRAASRDIGRLLWDSCEDVYGEFGKEDKTGKGRDGREFEFECECDCDCDCESGDDLLLARPSKRRRFLGEFGDDMANGITCEC